MSRLREEALNRAAECQAGNCDEGNFDDLLVIRDSSSSTSGAGASQLVLVDLSHAPKGLGG
jgi:hypothetical protein